MRRAKPAHPGQPIRLGRPRGVIHSAVEVAALLRVPVELVRRQLAAGGNTFFPGAYQEGTEWRIPASALAIHLGRKLEPHYDVRSIADLLACSYDHAWRQIKAAGIAVRIWGVLRVPESAVIALIEGGSV